MKKIKCVPDTLTLQYNPEKNSLLASWDFSRAYQNLIHVHTGLPVTFLPLLLRVYDVTGMYFTLYENFKQKADYSFPVFSKPASMRTAIPILKKYCMAKQVSCC
jgi:hypothetical protein